MSHETTAKDICERIQQFRGLCKTNDYTDSGDVWELLDAIEEDLKQPVQTEKTSESAQQAQAEHKDGRSEEVSGMK